MPPTWYKSNSNDIITEIWSKAIQEISKATHLMIIGYSMPRTDVFFDQLLTLGLRDNMNLQRVVVINPDPRINDTINDVFDKHFVANKVTFIPRGIEFLDSALMSYNLANRPVNIEKRFNNLIRTMETRLAESLT